MISDNEVFDSPTPHTKAMEAINENDSNKYIKSTTTKKSKKSSTKTKRPPKNFVE